MQKHFKRDIHSLTQIFEFTRLFKTIHQLDSHAVFTIEIILEEIFSNIIKYNHGENSDVLIKLLLIDQIILIKIIHHSEEPFDISNTDNYNTSATLDQRPIGKLGIHLVKNLADHISYQYQGGQSKITIKKRIKDLHV